MNRLLVAHGTEYALAGRLSGALALLDTPISVKARRGARAIRALPIGSNESLQRTTRRIICSLWRSNILLKHAHAASKPELWRFLETHVAARGTDIVEATSAHPCAIIATPHFGPFLPLCLDLIRRFEGKRRLNIMFNDPALTPSNRAHENLFRSLAGDVGFHYPDRKGTIAALKCLKRGEILALMPDVYFQSESIMAVPFFGRLFRAMPGTSFFAIRSGAPIFPVYPYPTERFGMEVVGGEPIRPEPDGREDDDEAMFRLTCRYFQDMQQVISREPHHWNYWDSFLQRSTLLELPADGTTATPPQLMAELERLARALANRFRQDPELEAEFAGFHARCRSMPAPTRHAP